MNKTKKIVSLVLAVMMVMSMLVVGAVSASAIEDGASITTLADLKAAATQGGTYTLGADITSSSAAKVDSDLTIDGQGHTITAFLSGQVFYLNNNTVNITLKNITFDLKNTAKSAVWAYDKSSGANTNVITLENCTVKNMNAREYVGAVHAFGKSSVVLKDCTFENNSLDVFFGAGGNITIEGTTQMEEVWVNGGSATATVKDEAQVDKITTADKDADDVLTIEDNAKVGGVIDKDGVDETMSSNVITDAASLQAAAYAGGKWFVANDFTAENYIYCYRDFDLDLGGNTITAESGFFIYNNADVTIDNGTVKATGRGAYVGDSTYTGGTLNVGKTAVFDTATGIFVGGKDAVLNVNGTVTASDWFAIGVNGSRNDTGSHDYTININSGANVKSTAADAAGIYQCNDGTLNIKGGTVEGPTAVIVKGGTTNISGGTLKGTGAAAEFVHNGNGADPTGDAVYVENSNYPAAPPVINVTGGTFTSENAKAIASYSQNEASYPALDEFITGGTYDDDSASAYVAEGYVLPKNADGTYTTRKTTATTTQSLASDDAFKANLLRSSYRLASIAGAQLKANVTTESTEETGNDINAKGVRFIAVVNEGLLKGDNIAEYGFVVAKVNGKDQTADFTKLTADGNNGQKVINCTGSSNGISGDYGLYSTSTTYKYVTLAVNGVAENAGDQAVARFYYKTTDGNTYYGVCQPTTSTTAYNGAIVDMPTA